MCDFRRLTLLCLENRLSKHKMTIFFKNLGAPWPLWLPLATPMAEGGPLATVWGPLANSQKKS